MTFHFLKRTWVLLFFLATICVMHLALVNADQNARELVALRRRYRPSPPPSPKRAPAKQIIYKPPPRPRHRKKRFIHV
ncbi:hypothetical protein O6P43_032679 [Quillaja saponaria]|uniref:Uncharacterized protein n=1 Tax=Quillaja saponaria TaxID=32244 RepID=A0AAD7KNG0_QUISA|nr:hypothetical protein O6P43_032679 [Quillaja saponaria]